MNDDEPLLTVFSRTERHLYFVCRNGALIDLDRGEYLTANGVKLPEDTTSEFDVEELLD